MKKLFLSLFILLLALGRAVAGDAFVIDHYTVNIQVMPNNVYQVQEHLAVHFTEPRHGLYRTLPLRYNHHWVAVDSVEVEGAPFTQTRDGDELTIKIGAEDTQVKGPQTYDISYRYDAGADSRPDMDEFSHYIVGVGWNTDILNVRFGIRMPKNFHADQVTCTAGPQGSMDSSRVAWTVEGRRITGHTLTPLGPHEGLTVALPLPEGYWEGARSPQPPNAWIWNRFVYPVSALAVILSLLIWFFMGRDKKIFPTEESDVPEGMTPAEISYILNGEVDSRALAVMPLYWAQRGYLAIKEVSKGGKMTLRKVKKLGKDAKPFEHTVFDNLFKLGKKGRVTSDDLRRLSPKTVNQAKADLASYFEESEGRAILTGKSLLWQACVLALSVLPIWGLHASLNGSLFGGLDMVSEGLVMAAIYISPAILLGESLTIQSTATTGSRIWRALGVLGVLALFGFYGYACADKVPWKVTAAGLGSSLFAALMVCQVSRRTPYGDQILARVLGFKKYVLAAEGEAESPSSRYFELLPYAMIMNTEESWARRFKAMTFIAPAWYLGTQLNDFDLFGDWMNYTVDRIDGFIDPSGDGSGSDGSGSGGGGGGDW